MNEHGYLLLVLIVIVLVLVAFVLGMMVQAHRTFLNINRIRKDSACRRCELEKARQMGRKIERRLRQG